MLSRGGAFILVMFCHGVAVVQLTGASRLQAGCTSLQT